MDSGRRSPGGAGHPAGLALLFTAGVLLVHALPALPAFSWIALGSLPALIPWRWRAAYAIFAFGVLWCVWRVGDDVARRWPPGRHGEERVVQGTVASLPERSVVTQAGTQTWRFQFQAAEAELPLMRVSWYRAEQSLRAGECWRLTLRMRTPHGSLNPGGFDYEAWLFRQGIGATASVRDGERCAGHFGPVWLNWRQNLLDRLQAWLPDHPGLPLLAALTIGDDSGLSDHDWDALRLTGTSHLVAVSGFNIAIVAGLAFFLGRWLWTLWPALCLNLPAQKAGMLLSAAAGVAYAFLAGWEAPVQRAAIMLGFLLAAAWFDRLRQPARVLALAWVAVLLVDPMAVMSPGAWLSFGAVAAIFYVSGGRLRSASVLREALRVQIALTLALAPLALFFFHGLSWATVPVNLVAVPVIAVLTPIALLALVLASVWPAIGIPLLGVVASALDQLQQGLDWIAGIASSFWWAASPPPAALALAGLGLALLLAPRGLPVWRCGLVCLAGLLVPPRQAPPHGFEVSVLDVGQGLSVVVQTAGHTLLYDAGPASDDGFDAGESVVVPYLLRLGVARLDAVVISHSDQDHAGGLKSVRRLMKVDAAYGAGSDHPCRDGESWNWDGLRFDFLHPPGDGDWSDNNGSCVLRVSGEGHSLLLTGDIEREAENRLVAVHGANLLSDVLVAPHHGSKTSSSAAFVDAVHPAVVVYGAGWRNHFKHPRPEPVARYTAIGARQYTTGVSGAVLLIPAEQGWVVDEYRRNAAHWWNAAAEP